MLKRYRTLVGTSLLLVSTLLSAAPTKNVLMIAVDDLNDWTGEFGGHPQAKTPNIDKLARMGVSFQSAYSASPVCNPSRTALLTGRRPHETSIDSNGGGNFRKSKQQWVRELVTLPQYFDAQGYKTAAIGKIFHKPAESQGEFALVEKNSGGQSRGPQKKINGSKIVWSEGKLPLEKTSDWKNADYGAASYSKSMRNHFSWPSAYFAPTCLGTPPKHFMMQLLPLKRFCSRHTRKMI